MKRYVPLYALLICFIAVSPLQAEFPSTINYQGRLVDGTNLVSAVVDMRFRLYPESVGGSPLFESTNSVLVVDGLYATEIGEHTILGDLHEALNQYPVYLEVAVNGDVLTPRERFTAVPYALQAAPPSQGQNVSIIDTNGVETFYPSLTNAFEALESGHTLRLYPGDHYLEVAPVHGGNPVGKAGLILWDKANIRIEGIGNARIYSDQYGDYLYIRDSYNIDIEGITFDGAGPNPGTQLNFAMINFRGTNKNIRIRNCRFTNYGRHGISHLHHDKLTTHVQIKGCYFANGGDALSPTLSDDGASISGIGSYWTITGNHLQNVLRGFEVEGPGPSAQKHITISDNILRDIWSLGIMLFPSSGVASNYTDILITGNQLTGKDPQPPEVTFSGGAIVIQGGERIVIKNNVIDRFPGSLYGIAFMSSVDIRDSVIEGNVIRNAPGHAIRIWALNNNDIINGLVAGNHISGTTQQALWISGKRHALLNNYIHAGTNIAIDVFGGTNTQDIVLGQNIVHSHDTGIRIQADVQRTRVKNNVLYDNNTDLIDDGTDTEF